VRLPRVSALVCIVTDRRRLRPGQTESRQLDALVEQARAAASAGVDLFQIRERGVSDRVLWALAERIVAVASGSPMRVLLNDRLDVALACGAHGVHLREDSLTPEEVRRMAPSDLLVGRSVHAAAAAEQAAAAGADLVVFGSVYDSASKGPGHQPAGAVALARVVRACRVPVLAIGGITDRHLREIAASGAAGVAAIGWLATTDADRLGTRVAAVREAFDSREPVP
jgi:thiamine-phosphate diphosphorylase